MSRAPGSGIGTIEDLPAPEVVARERVEDLTAALAEFEAVTAPLEANGAGGAEEST